jgi:multiple sugar transport system substrate-binding protein
MKRLTILLALLTAAGFAWAQTVIRVQGYGGQDPAQVALLLSDVIGEQLAAEGITLQYEPIQDNYNAVLTNALSAGTAADVFYIPGETAPGFIATGKVLPLNDLVDTSPFIGSLVDVYTQDGQVYGIPKDFNTLAVFYNEDLFDEAGVEYPNADDDWNTFADKLRAVSDALGSDVYGACFPADFARMGAFAYGNGWQPLDAEGNANLQDPAFVEAFDWYTGLVREGVAVQPSDVGAGWPGDCLAREQAAVAIEGAWMLGFLRDAAPNLQYGTTLLPKSPNTGERGNFIYSVAWAVNADSPNRDAAIKVLEALTSEEAQQFILERGLAIPSREALADNPFFQEDSPEAQANLTVFEGASDGNVLGFQFGNVGTDYMNPINNALTAAMTGQADSAAALASAQQELSTLLERSRSR